MKDTVTTTNGNRSLICFAASLPLTTAILIAILNGPMMVMRLGLPLYVMAVGLVIAGLIFALVAKKAGEEKFRYQFGLVFNAIMIFALIMVLAMFIFLRIDAPGMM
ncbi:MAG TPA: hypothetical protein VGG19_18965 [Tepidisphaeraceae bacterium]|jgi:hypothetical protein